MKESYDEGYKTGRNWKNKWVPGGPYASDDESLERRRVWREGFHDGLEVNRYKKTEDIQELFKSLKIL